MLYLVLERAALGSEERANSEGGWRVSPSIDNLLMLPTSDIQRAQRASYSVIWWLWLELGWILAVLVADITELSKLMLPMINYSAVKH